MTKKYLSFFAAISGFIFFPMSAFASCADYPNKIIGTKFVRLENDKLKILSTYQIGVNFDDADDVVDAIEDGRYEAKAAISEFMNTQIAKECSNNRKVLSGKLLTNDPSAEDSKRVDKVILKEKICNLVGKTSALLKGVSDVGQCYEPGKHVYVTVGIKPETIAAAGQLGEDMKTINKFDDINGLNQSEIGGNKSSTREVEGFSNYDADF